jgi:branched-subunit amino acid ABC-type transport system permease component
MALSLSTFLTFFWNGLVEGSLIALAGLGLTLLFGLLNFINIAYGEYMAWGAYFTLLSKVIGLPFVAAILVGVIGGGVVAIAADRIVFRNFSNRSPVVLLVVSIGVSFILRNLIRLLVPSQYTTALYGVELLHVPNIAGITILGNQVVVLVLSVLTLGGVFLLLNRTRIGIAMRAASDDTDLARIRGIDTDRLVIYVTALGGTIAGIAGIMLGLESQVTPSLGFTFLIPVFAAVILGGIGDPVGAVVAGLAIGIAQKVSLVIIPSEYTPAIALLVLIIGLLTRPDGVFGEATR